MGYMSRQWLNRGEGKRDRSYGPIPVAVACYSDEFNGMKIRFSARKADGQYQTLFLSETEVNAALRLFHSVWVHRDAGQNSSDPHARTFE